MFENISQNSIVADNSIAQDFAVEPGDFEDASFLAEIAMVHRKLFNPEWIVYIEGGDVSYSSLVLPMLNNFGPCFFCLIAPDMLCVTNVNTFSEYAVFSDDEREFEWKPSKLFIEPELLKPRLSYHSKPLN